MKTPSRLRLVAIGLLLLLAGFVIGLYVGWRQGASTLSWLGAVSQDHVVSELAYAQYLQGDYPSAREALEGHLTYLEHLLPHGEENWAKGQSPFLGERSLAADKTLTLARLALVEEDEHGPSAGDALWARAEEQAALAGWKDSSRANIRQLVERLDLSLEDES
jgi:hypothetical protein